MIEAEIVEEQTVAALAPIERTDALVRPAADVADIAQAFTDYQELKQKLLTDDDYQRWRERGQERSFVKRSGWRKLAVAFGVSFEQRSQTIVRRDPDDATSEPVYAEFVVRAIAPNGRYVDGWGACSLDEPRFEKDGARKKLHHDLPSTAETRAKNRAAADLFGMGEVSAEEASEGPGAGAERAPSGEPGPSGSREEAVHGAGDGEAPAKGAASSPASCSHTWVPAARDGFEMCSKCRSGRRKP